MRDISTQLLDTAKIVILAALLVVGVNYAFAVWTGAPASGPPNDNVDAPVNVGNIGQIKTSGLMLNWSELAPFGLKVNPDGTKQFSVDNAGFAKVSQGLAVGSIGTSGLSTGEIKASAGITGSQFCLSDGCKGAWSEVAASPIWAKDVTTGEISYTGGNVSVNDGNSGSSQYLNLDTNTFSSSGGTPITTECSESSDAGKAIYNPSNHNLYICGTAASDGGSLYCSNGFCWRWVTMSDR